MVGAIVAQLAGLAERPLLLVGALAVVGTAAAVAGWRVKRWLEDPVDRFCRVVKSREEVVVLLHPNPDPDAMASGMAVAHLVESVGTRATIQHAGEVRHPENRAFADVFDLDLRQIDDARGLACRDVVLVDHNDPRGFAGAGGLTPLAVIDHHPGGGEGALFTDVRTDYGACATIMVEYLRDREIPIPTVLATALLRGIQSDTKSMTRGCTPAEFDAAEFLYDAVDPVLLDRVATPSLDAEFLDVRARAIANRVEDGPFVVSDVGTVTNVDAIAGAADELRRIAGSSAVVVCGTHDGTLHLSGRSRDDSVHVGEALRQAVDDIPMSDGGGHARMGGAQVSVPHLNGIGPSSGVGRDELVRRVFDALHDATRINQPDA